MRTILRRVFSSRSFEEIFELGIQPRFIAQETVNAKLAGKVRRLFSVCSQMLDLWASCKMFPVILSGWKEIASHLRYGVRTVQRWERNGLPVKRVNNARRSPVVADSEELDAWILHRIRLPLGASRERTDNLQRARELRRESQEMRKELRARMDVLKKTLAEARAKLRR